MANYDMPSTKLVECTFNLLEGTVSTQLGKGMGFNVTQIADPMWKVSIETIPLDRASRQSWHSWKTSLRGGLNRFVAVDMGQRAPLAYPGANHSTEISSGWPGTCSVTNLGLSGAMSLSGLPTGYVVSAGDRVELHQDGYFGLYEIQSTMVATNGSVDIAVMPFIHLSYFNTSAVARLWRPRALFIIDHESWDMTVTPTPTSIKFDGYQVLK